VIGARSCPQAEVVDTWLECGVSIGDGLADLGKGSVPGQEFFDSMDWMVCNTREHVREVGFRIDTVQLCRANQAVHRGSALAAGIRSRKKIVLSAQSYSRRLRSAALLSISSRPSSQ